MGPNRRGYRRSASESLLDANGIPKMRESGKGRKKGRKEGRGFRCFINQVVPRRDVLPQSFPKAWSFLFLLTVAAERERIAIKTKWRALAGLKLHCTVGHACSRDEMLYP